MEAFESFEHAGFTVELHQDWEASSPADFDNLGELVSFPALWREYAFGKDGQTPGRESTEQEDEAFERGGWRLLERYLLTACGYVCAVPFEFYDYGSGGQVLRYTEAPASRADRVAGFIVTTADRVEELGAPRDDVERQLRAELEDWRAYVAGEVSGYVVRDASGGAVESCFGFYPDGEGDGLGEVRAEARSAAEAVRSAVERRARQTARGWAMAHGVSAVTR